MRALRGIGLISLAGACVAVFIAGTMVAPPLDPLPVDPFWLAWAGFPIVGSVILLKRPGNDVGKIMMAIGACVAVSTGASLAVDLGAPAPDYLTLVNQLVFLPVFGLVPLLIMVFPSGELVAPRLKSASWIVFATILLGAVWVAVRPVDYSIDNVAFYPNPLGIDVLVPLDIWVMGLLQFLLVLLVAGAAVHAIFSFRRGSALYRLQVRWVLTPALLLPILFVLGNLTEEATGLTELGNVTAVLAILVGGNGIAAGIGIAVLRYRLYDIDRIVSRTVTYAAVVAVLGLVLFGLVALLALFLPSDDPLVVAISTLAVAGLFNPVARRARTTVDRRFNRSRYDAERVIERFTDDLGNQPDPDRVVDGWVAVVDETMQPKSLSVWVR